MVDTVGFIYWIANFLLVFAVKVVIQTFNVVAGIITLAVIEGMPAACAVRPRFCCKGTIPTVQLTGQRVAFLVAYTIVGFAQTVCDRTRRCGGLQDSVTLLTPFTYPATGTLAVKVWEACFLSAQTTVMARLGGAAVIAAMLALWSAITSWAGAACSPFGEGTATAVVA